MHDCEATRARLIDLIFGEARDADALRAEVRSCADCAAEHRALSETLRAFDRAAEDARPSEGFWPQYHARLARRIDAAESEAALTRTASVRASSPAAWLGRALRAKWRVPAPVAVAALVLIACLTPLALRRSPAAVAPAEREKHGATPAGEPPQVRTIEVPVVHEKIVTRTIYVARPARKTTRAVPTGEARLAASPPSTRDEPAPGRDTLTGFRPAGDVRLRVIKGSFEDER